MTPARSSASEGERSSDFAFSGPHRRSLSLGLLAMAPLFAAYELGLAASASGERNTSEMALLRAVALAPVPERELRVASLAAAAILALALCFRRRVPLGPPLLRTVLEGVLGALLLGPLLALAMKLMAAGVGRLAVAPGPPPIAPGPAEAALVFGGAAYEELLFRVGALPLAFLGARSILRFLGAGERAARWVAASAAVLLSSLAFAAFHLAAFNGWLGPGGEQFSAAVFAWRGLAGASLALLFLWRGPGVAAWTHGLFNFALLLGAGPEVLL